jgi:hypothetical protein
MWTELNQFVLSLITRVHALVSIVAIAVLTNIGKSIVTKLGEVEKAL